MADRTVLLWWSIGFLLGSVPSEVVVTLFRQALLELSFAQCQANCSNTWAQISTLNCFYVGTLCGVHLFDHLLWSIFQASITHYIKQFFQVLTCFLINYLFSLKNFRLCQDLNRYLPGTKRICYQLSYSGLDHPKL